MIHAVSFIGTLQYFIIRAQLQSKYQSYTYKKTHCSVKASIIFLCKNYKTESSSFKKIKLIDFVFSACLFLYKFIKLRKPNKTLHRTHKLCYSTYA